jgi:hypothetical protein
MVTLEESKEGSLSTGSTLDTSETDIVASALNVSEIPEKFLATKAAREPSYTTLKEQGKLTWIQRVARFPTVVS